MNEQQTATMTACRGDMIFSDENIHKNIGDEEAKIEPTSTCKLVANYFRLIAHIDLSPLDTVGGDRLLRWLASRIQASANFSQSAGKIS